MRPHAQLLALALLTFGALPSAAAQKTKLLVLDLKTTAVEDDTALLVAELMAVQLSQFDVLEVFAGADVKRMMELEANKLATGCDDDSSCIADIAGALGTRYVIYGRLGKLGSRYVITLNLFDADEGKAVKRGEIKAANLDQLGDELGATLDELVAPLVGEPEKVAVDRAPAVADPIVPGPAVPRPIDRGAETMRTVSNSMYLVGGVTGASAYGCAALFGLIDLAADGNAGLTMLLPVVGPALYPSAAGDRSLDGPCLTCAGVQAAGLVIAGVGWLLAPEDDAPSTAVVEISRDSPRLAAQMKMAY